MSSSDERIEYQGVSRTRDEWAAALGVTRATLDTRMRNSTSPAVWFAPRREKPTATQRIYVHGGLR